METSPTRLGTVVADGRDGILRHLRDVHTVAGLVHVAVADAQVVPLDPVLRERGVEGGVDGLVDLAPRRVAAVAPSPWEQPCVSAR